MTFKPLQIILNNKDLERTSKWATQWKINFNPYTTKQAQQATFSHKLKKVHPPLLFNNVNVTDIFPETLGNYP